MRPGKGVITWRTVGPIVPLVLLLTVAAGVWYWFERKADLSGDELRALVAGNTVAGLWGTVETPYRHYAGPDGGGLTARDGAAPEDDPWQISAEGAYCARLGGTEAGCYRARRKADFYLWIDQDKGLGYPFRVLPGEQLETTPSTTN